MRKFKFYPQSSHICAGFENKRNCVETGSPLFNKIRYHKNTRYNLFGIQSYGESGTCLYTDVTKYIDWIMGIILKVDVIVSTVFLGMFDNLPENRKRYVKHTVLSVYTHKLYNKQTFEHDVALLLIDGPVTYKKSIRPVCIRLGEINNLNNLKANRWGISEKMIFRRINKAQILKIKKCRDSFGITVKKSQICAGFQSGRICTEPGSSLVKQINISGKLWKTLIGIQSYGVSERCIYNKIAHYIDWILGIVLRPDRTKGRPGELAAATPANCVVLYSHAFDSRQLRGDGCSYSNSFFDLHGRCLK
ncbi:GM16374 [Drosophila sechellia]|uniref:GM16374 n=1 Tax=Drosophila sechellia TaxID=7238 RepID=B4IGZ8_DROSE|nr:GM16374 [Drosophila sechellia]